MFWYVLMVKSRHDPVDLGVAKFQTKCNSNIPRCLSGRLCPGNEAVSSPSSLDHGCEDARVLPVGE